MATAAQASTNEVRGFRRLWRVLRQLFHEMTGAVFAILALAWARAAFVSYSRDAARWLTGMAVAVAALMALFAWTSFRRSRRVQ